jgi:hypothetical protein
MFSVIRRLLDAHLGYGDLIRRLLAGGLESIQGIEGVKVRLLGSQELRRVTGREDFILPDQAAGRVGEGLLNPAVRSRIEEIDSPLVRRHPAQQTQGMGTTTALHPLQAHADELLLIGIHVHRTGRHRRGTASNACHAPIFVDRHQLHPAIRGDTRLVRLVRRVHRVHVVEDLSGPHCGALDGFPLVIPGPRQERPRDHQEDDNAECSFSHEST